jgi:predicted 3-demethylubiquinone-9 3-methyltransferase (glyoxalase superfamily)
MFQKGDAEQAMNFYVSLFGNSGITHIDRYGPEGPGAEGSVRVASFTVAGQPLMCIDSPVKHNFTFTPAVSLLVDCESEAEFDEAFAKLADGGAVMMPPGDYGFSKKFGWVQDRFGVSWQLMLR